MSHKPHLVSTLSELSDQSRNDPLYASIILGRYGNERVGSEKQAHSTYAEDAGGPPPPSLIASTTNEYGAWCF